MTKYVENNGHPEFKAFCDKSRASRPGSLNLDLYLIMPVQRIPRYNLLLKDLIDHTTAEHPDYKYLQKALESTKSVATYVNSSVNKLNNMNQIAQLQQSLGSSCPNLMAAHRILLFGGKLKRVQTNVTNTTPVRIYLFNDVILFTHKTLIRSYAFKKSLAIELLWIKDHTDNAVNYDYPSELNNKRVFMFEVYCPGYQYQAYIPASAHNTAGTYWKTVEEISYVLISESEEEKNEWVEAISFAIESILSKKANAQKAREQLELSMKKRGVQFANKPPPGKRATVKFTGGSLITPFKKEEHPKEDKEEHPKEDKDKDETPIDPEAKEQAKRLSKVWANKQDRKEIFEQRKTLMDAKNSEANKKTDSKSLKSSLALNSVTEDSLQAKRTRIDSAANDEQIEIYYQKEQEKQNKTAEELKLEEEEEALRREEEEEEKRIEEELKKIEEEEEEQRRMEEEILRMESELAEEKRQHEIRISQQNEIKRQSDHEDNNKNLSNSNNDLSKSGGGLNSSGTATDATLNKSGGSSINLKNSANSNSNNLNHSGGTSSDKNSPTQETQKPKGKPGLPTRQDSVATSFSKDKSPPIHTNKDPDNSTSNHNQNQKSPVATKPQAPSWRQRVGLGGGGDNTNKSSKGKPSLFADHPKRIGGDHKLVKEGYLTKMGAVRHSWKERWFILSDKGLFYYKNEKDNKLLGFLKLDNKCTLSTGARNKNTTIEVVTTDRTLLVYSEKPGLTQEWLDALRTASSIQ